MKIILYFNWVLRYNYIMELRKGTKMKQVLYKSKSEIRAESEKTLESFLKSGGVIEVVKAKRIPKVKMSCKNSRNFLGSSKPEGITVSNFWR